MSTWVDTGAAFVAPLGTSALLNARHDHSITSTAVSQRVSEFELEINRLKEENDTLHQQIAELTESLRERTNQCLQNNIRYEQEHETSQDSTSRVAELTVELTAEKRKTTQLASEVASTQVKYDELLALQQETHQRLQETAAKCLELSSALGSAYQQKELEMLRSSEEISKLRERIAQLEAHVNEQEKRLSPPPCDSPPVANGASHLLETKIWEARHLQWMAHATLRESALFFDQCEHVRGVYNELQQVRQEHGGDACTYTSLIDHCNALGKMINELEISFDTSRAQAATLSDRFVSARHDLQGELLYTIEPEIDRIDRIYHSYPPAEVAELNAVCAAINQSIRYRPGESKLRQTQSAESFGGSTSIVYLHSLRADAAALLPTLSSFCDAIATRFKITVLKPAATKPLARVLEEIYVNHKGDYAFACDIAQCCLCVESLSEVKDLIYFLGNMEGERKRIHLPTDMATGRKIPRFAIMAVKNKFIPNYDALTHSAGCRDVCIYLRFAESRHPLHVVEVQLMTKEYVQEGCMAQWIAHIVEIAKPLRLFNDPARSHFGAIQNVAQIKNGIIQSVNIDHFSFTTSGGHVMISALSQATYSGMQEVSLCNSGVSDDDLMMLLAVLSNHGRLKVLRASGSRELRGALTNIPWDVFSMPPRNALQVSGFQNLQRIDLSSNAIRGHIHPFLSTTLPSLRYLNLSDNALTGHIPPDIGNLSNLQHLLLARNELSGPIPPSLGNLSALKDLQLWQNKLTGAIPVEICRLSSLVRFNIDSCMLCGSLPPDLSQLTSLKELYCFNNQLEGELPAEMFAGMQNLQHLGLNGNRFCGTLPSEISQLRRLKTLFLHENFLTGQLPLELGSLGELKKLSLRGNKLHGELPYSLWSLSSLTALALAENQFCGSIPLDISQLQNLEAITVANNQFSGQVPVGLLRLPRIRSIDLTKNQFTGSLPPDIGRTTSLQDLLLGDNELHGLIPPDIGHLKLLAHLEMQGNRFEGHIPIVELSNLKNLRALDMSRNHLSGTALAEKHIKERLKNCFVNINLGQRPSVVRRDPTR